MTDEIAAAPGPFPTVAVATVSGPVTVACEPVGEWLAITPDFGMGEDGTAYLTGTFSLTFRPTGFLFSDAGGCIECARAAGRELLGLPLDWAALAAGDTAAFTAGLDADGVTAFTVARGLSWRCDAEYCEELGGLDDDGTLARARAA